MIERPKRTRSLGMQFLSAGGIAAVVVVVSILVLGVRFLRHDFDSDGATSFLLFVLLANVLSLIFFGVVLYRLYLSVSRPIEEMSHGMRRYWTGDFSARVAVGSDDEIGYLQQSFNEMAEKIERMVKELKELDQMKSEFISTVSHELRTPLTSIAGYIKLIISGDTGPVAPNQKEFLEIVDRNVERLGQLIDEVLDVEKIAVGKMEIQRVRLNLSDVISECTTTLSVLAQRKGLYLAFERPDEPIPVAGDRARLTQVFLNFLHNAVKYTLEGGIRVTIERTDFSVVVNIQDTGLGMSEEEQSRLFERFYRAKGGIASSEAGTGLGLVIAQGLIDAHGGEILVTSARGKGTCFSVTLPLASERARILLANPDRDLRTLAKRALEKKGFWVDEIAGAMDALVLTEGEAYGAILVSDRFSSVQMAELMKAVQEKNIGQSILLLVAREITPLTERKASSAGFVGVLTELDGLDALCERMRKEVLK